MADFASKLNILQVVEGPPQADLTTLLNPEGYYITTAWFHNHHQTFGSSFIVTLIVDGEERIAFLPKRFAHTLCQSEVDLLLTGGYKLRCTQIVNMSPVIRDF